MTYKTILVQLNDERRAGPLIEAARMIGEQEEAHVVGVYAVPTIAFGSPTQIGLNVIEAGRKRYHDEAQRIKTTFEEAMRGRAVKTEFRLLEARHGYRDCAELVIEQARSADLIIAAQADKSWDETEMLDFPDRIAMESARPALIIPNAGRFPKIGSRVLVAWSGTREASRAVFDALPFLQRASIVTLLSIKRNSHRGEERVIEGADIAATLSRHGVKCEVAVSVAADISIEDDLLSRASDYSADLIVMGCYGHSRLREFIMGGTTRGILAHMTVPVLMSH